MKHAIITLALLLMVVSAAQAQVTIDTDKLANAIYKAEGGSKTNHPYGIMVKYKTTTPRQACINTIRHAMRDYTGNDNAQEFIKFLGSRYCPIGCDNDNGTNKYWVGNVTRLYYSN